MRKRYAVRVLAAALMLGLGLTLSAGRDGTAALAQGKKMLAPTHRTAALIPFEAMAYAHAFGRDDQALCRALADALPNASYAATAKWAASAYPLRSMTERSELEAGWESRYEAFNSGIALMRDRKTQRL